MKVIDLQVETQATESAFDDVMQGLPGAQAVVEGSGGGGTVTVRCFGTADFVRFAIESQGYGAVVGETEIQEVER